MIVHASRADDLFVGLRKRGAASSLRLRARANREVESANSRPSAFCAAGRRSVIRAQAPGELSGEFRDQFLRIGEASHKPAAAEKEATAPLPMLRLGDAVTALDVTATGKRTLPPKPFNDASLIAAMCGVAKFVKSPALKKILTEADGIGTPATRAAIIETLFERGYVERVKRAIVSTETGRALVASLPDVATTPDMTATWEAALRAITDGTQTSGAFLARVSAHLEHLVADGRALGRIAVPAAPPAPPPARRSSHKSTGADARTPNTERPQRS